MWPNRDLPCVSSRLSGSAKAIAAVTVGLGVASIPANARVLLLTDDSQIGANLRVCVDEEHRANFDQRR
jgi:hypothetical protein